jgi:hypothetical protein
MSKAERFTNATGAPVADNTTILTAGRRVPEQKQLLFDCVGSA